MSTSKGGSSSKAKPKLFTSKDILTKEQQEERRIGGASILEESLRGGFSPEERAGEFARRADPINRAFKTSLEDLSGITARSGLKGGAAVTDIKSLLGERIRGLGAAAGETETASRDIEKERKDRLLQLLGITPPALLGQESTGKSREVSFGL